LETNYLSICLSVCLSVAAVATNDTSKSTEPRAPLAEMEDIEMKKKKEKPVEVLFTRVAA